MPGRVDLDSGMVEAAAGGSLDTGGKVANSVDVRSRRAAGLVAVNIIRLEPMLTAAEQSSVAARSIADLSALTVLSLS